MLYHDKYTIDRNSLKFQYHGTFRKDLLGHPPGVGTLGQRSRGFK